MLKEEIENEDVETDGEEAEGEGSGKKKLAGKKIVLFIVLPLLVLTIGGGAGWYFFMGSDEELAEGEETEQVAEAPEEVFFYDLPEMLVNLSNNNGGVNYLKLSVAIELENQEAITFIEPLMPRVVDRFQVYLRGLRVADLNGSAGMYQLKNELMRRVNAAVLHLTDKCHGQHLFLATGRNAHELA